MQTTTTPAAGLAMPQGLTLAEKVLEHVVLSDTGLRKAAAMEKKAAATATAIAVLIPQVVEQMVKFDRIGPDQRTKLASMLQNPVTVLELLIKVAGHRNPEELAKLGELVNTDGQVKTAGARQQPSPASSLTSPYVGARTTMVKQSDVNLFKGLGLRQ